MNSQNEHGPHGGTWVQTEDGLIEISVFERNVPPRFRLYFLDAKERPRNLPSEEITVDTVRPDGAKQLFTFTPHENFLESNSDIPEPHEFEVSLKIAHGGHAHLYKTKFTEEGHSHGGDSHPAHGHSHAEGEAHEHAHATGIFGWFQNTFAHSHSAADKIDASMETHERGIWALKISLVGLLITAGLQLAVYLISGSVGLLADLIHNFADAGTSIPLWIAFALARRGASRRFTYGYGKSEDVAGVLIILIIFFSACVAAYESVMKIIHPQPVTNLGWVAVAAIIGFLGNEAVAVFRIKVGKEIGSAALIADGQHARVDGFTSLAVLIGVAGVYFGFPILDPLVGIGITIAILFIVKNATISIFLHLLDGIEPEILKQIEHAPTHVPGVLAVKETRARWLGHKVHCDLTIEVDPTRSVAEADKISSKVEEALLSHVRQLGKVVVHVHAKNP